MQDITNQIIKDAKPVKRLSDGKESIAHVAKLNYQHYQKIQSIGED